MLFMRRRVQTFIILAIIAVSVFAAIQVAGMPHRKPRAVEMDLREPRKVFEEAMNYQKTIMNFIVSDFAKAVDRLNTVLANDGVKIYYKVRSGNGIVTVFDVKPDIDNVIIQDLRAIERLDNEKSETALARPEGYLDVENHVKQFNVIQARYRERLQSPHLTTREIGELQQQIRTIQTKVDSLNSIRELEQIRSNQLFFVTLRTAPTTSSGRSLLNDYINLLKWIVVFMIIFTVLTMILYFSYILIAKVMKTAGIKTAKSSSRYGSYGYGYSYAGKRKKHKSRRKKSAEKEEESNEENKEEK